jgi:hypothetical protein
MDAGASPKRAAGALLGPDRVKSTSPHILGPSDLG